MALYAPRPRVRLKDWAKWQGASWPTLQRRVGDGFRMPASHETVHTMAANAVLRLIEQNQIHPQNIGCLVFSTSMPTDRVAGASVVKGMVDEALVRVGRSSLARVCEVPEIRHSDLGGMYALKYALRFVKDADVQSHAIVVAADVAESRPGTFSEQTQGAGAVAMLVEAEPKLFEVDLTRAASASRAFEGRPPLPWRVQAGSGPDDSAAARCLDTVWYAVSAMLEEGAADNDSMLDEAAAIIMQRPYEELPIRALTMLTVHRMALSDGGQRRLRGLAKPAGVDIDGLLTELNESVDLWAPELLEQEAEHPQLSRVLSHCCAQDNFRQRIEDKLALGRSIMRQLGNLSAAALPAGIGAALEEAHVRQVRLSERSMVAIGFGLGDAAEAWPLRVVKKWRTAAARLGFDNALQDAVTLDRSTYERARASGSVPDVDPGGAIVAPAVPSAAVSAYHTVA